MSGKPMESMATKLIHAGELEHRPAGAVSMPIYQSSTFESTGETSYHDIKYIRLNNTPNHEVLNAKIAVLEGGEAALVASSGMAAISTALLTILQAGDHVLAHECLYGGTRDLMTTDFEGYGIHHTFIDADDPKSWKAHLRENTKAIYVETITNPLIQVGDLKSVVAFAKENGLLSMIDNTFASPVNFRPIEHGFDLVFHSCTKYMNGHSDIVAGVVVGSGENVARIRHKLNHLGGSLDPHACFLLHRGLKTMSLRVQRQNENALKMANFLEQHEAVERVHYPGLKSHPQHRRACDLFDGFGGMLSFELKGGAPAAQRLIEGVTLPVNAPSLGGVESLITIPATTSHLCIARKDRERMGISDGLIRFSIGIEGADDLMQDLSQALGRTGRC